MCLIDPLCFAHRACQTRNYKVIMLDTLASSLRPSNLERSVMDTDSCNIIYLQFVLPKKSAKPRYSP